MSSFGGHHAKQASDQLQKKLQEEAMADDADKLAAGMAGMDVTDPVDNMSIGSSNSETQIAMLQAQNRHLQSQNNVMAMTNTTLTQQLAETSAAVSLDQQNHNRIISNYVFTNALGAMQGPDLDENTLWWMVQWGNEYLARFKQNPNIPLARKQAHARYKKWTADTRQKQITGFTASLRARTGDDSFDQE